MGILTKLPNIGDKLEKQLFDVGITTEEELRRVGSREPAHAPNCTLQRAKTHITCRRVSLSNPCPSFNLDSETKASLKEFYQKHK